MVAGAFLLALGDLRDRRVLTVLVKSLALTLALLAVLAASIVWAARWTVGDRLSLGVGAGTLAGAAAALLAALLGWLLFRGVAVAVIGLFADAVVDAVEARHYPAALRTARPVPMGRSLRLAAGSLGRTLGVNLLMAPLYLLLLATGVGMWIALLLVNGWLLGRDLFDMVAARHLAPAAMRPARATARGGRLLLGLAGTGLLVVPVLGLIGPVLGAAAATHWYHRRAK